MRILQHLVPRHVIDAGIDAAVYPGHDPARWARPLLDELERAARGWHLVELDELEFAALWLPAHAGEACHGDTMQLGDDVRGDTVRTIGDWLDANAATYAASNPSCWGRIAHAAGEAPSPIVVSATSVGDRVKPAHARLVVVDGLHRALGSWKAGRRRCEAYMPATPP